MDNISPVEFKLLPRLTGDEWKGSMYGYSHDICGNFAAVGAPYYNNSQGAVLFYKYDSISTGWNLTHIEYGPSGNTRYGFDVAIQDRFVIVGAPNSDNKKGRVHVYKLNQEGIVESEILFTASDGQDDDHYGTSVDILNLEDQFFPLIV